MMFRIHWGRHPGLKLSGLLLGLCLSAVFGESGGAVLSASLVVDADSGAVLHEEEATRLWYPASLTKMMTLYLTFAAIEAGELAVEEKLTASAHVAAQPDSRLGLGKGDTLTVREAILAVVAQSANDAAVALAERMAGSEGAFSVRMTDQARALGMTRTVFRNATGLPHNDQVTTARDLALLALALQRDFPQHYHFFSERHFKYKGVTYSSINRLLGAYAGADGLKTGFTCGSGYNLVASARRENRRLIGVVLGAISGGERTTMMTRLLNIGFKTQAADGALRLAALEPSLAAAAEPPVFRLKASQCNLGTGVRDVTGGKLTGWGLLFGVFPDQAQARQYVAKMQGKLRPVISSGQAAVVRRQVEDITTWKALLVGLKQNDAIAACLHLIKTDNICLVQSPQLLNPPPPPTNGDPLKQ